MSAALDQSPSRGRCLQVQFLLRTPGRGGKGLQLKVGGIWGDSGLPLGQGRKMVFSLFLEKKLEKILSA